MGSVERVVLGIDPGLAHTGWGVVSQRGPHLSCLAYGCVSTSPDHPLAERLLKIHDQIDAVVNRFHPTYVGIETVWFGQNVTAAFATGQARGAALVACAEAGLTMGEFTPRQIKLAVVGTGTASKEQIQYMTRQLLVLDDDPRPDHAADALAAAICYVTHESQLSQIQQGERAAHAADAANVAEVAHTLDAAHAAEGHVAEDRYIAEDAQGIDSDLQIRCNSGLAEQAAGA